MMLVQQHGDDGGHADYKENLAQSSPKVPFWETF